MDQIKEISDQNEQVKEAFKLCFGEGGTGKKDLYRLNLLKKGQWGSASQVKFPQDETPFSDIYEELGVKKLGLKILFYNENLIDMDKIGVRAKRGYAS